MNFTEPSEVQRPRKLWLVIGISFVVFLVAALVGGAILVFRSTRVQQVLVKKTVEHFVPVEVEPGLIEKALGYEGPRTYLLLFLNNTELRPAGGFIGSYGVITFRNGVPELVKTEGTEIIDNYAPDAYLTPPGALAQYLKIKKWQFRDSNWSPDFSSAAQLGLSMYKNQRGEKANEIDGVIAVTPTVLEEFLKILGPVSVNGETFDHTNFIEKLQYEVEYGYEKRGLSFADRKQMLHDLAPVILRRLVTDIFKHWGEYTTLVPRMLDAKQIIGYSLHPDEQAYLARQNWAGLMQSTPADYVLWTDANLGAMKTDASITRSLTYTIEPKGSTYVARATMRFVHRGSYDWRTTRYQDFARMYVPKGSKLVRVEGALGAGGRQEQGEENGRQWFGAFVRIDPKKTGELTFVYELAPSVVEAIKRGEYQLLVQKQIGTIAPPLKLRLDFGRKLDSAFPGESKEKHGDSVYEVSTDLSIDRAFSVKLQ